MNMVDNKITFAIVLVLLVLFQSSGFLVANMLLAIVCALAFAKEEKIAIQAGFGCGILLDLVSGSRLGSSSLAFLLVLALIFWGQRFVFSRAQALIVPFFALGLVIFDAVFSFLNRQTFVPSFDGWFVLESLLVVPVSLVMYEVVNRWNRQKNIQTELKV